MRWPRLLLLGSILTAGETPTSALAHESMGASKFPGVPLQRPSSTTSGYSRSSGVRVLSHFDPGGGFNADVVAHKGFAYLASWGVPSFGSEFCPSLGVRVVDLSNPRRPKLVSTFGSAALEPDLAGTWTEKVIVRSVRTATFRGDLAVASLQACYGGDPEVLTPVAGFGVWDVTDPTRPRRLGLYSTGTVGVHELWVQARGNRVHAYVAVPLSEFLTSPDPDPQPQQPPTTPGVGDFRIVDLTNPSRPVDVATWGAWRELGVPAYPPHSLQVNFAHSVFGSGNRAYVSYWDLGTLTFDVATPSAPRLISRSVPAPQTELHAHSSWLGNEDSLLIQTSEDFSPEAIDELGVEAAWGYVRFYELSDTAGPRQLGTFELPSTRPPLPPAQQPPGYFSVHDAKVLDQTAYFSWYSEGVVAVDISRPRRPRKIAQLVPEPSADPRGFFGDSQLRFPIVWGVFPTEDYVLASDINSGLWVFELQKDDDKDKHDGKDDDDKDGDGKYDDDKDGDYKDGDQKAGRDEDSGRGWDGRGNQGDRGGSVSAARAIAGVTPVPALGTWGAPFAAVALLWLGVRRGRRFSPCNSGGPEQWQPKGPPLARVALGQSRDASL